MNMLFNIAIQFEMLFLNIHRYLGATPSRKEWIWPVLLCFVHYWSDLAKRIMFLEFNLCKICIKGHKMYFQHFLPILIRICGCLYKDILCDLQKLFQIASTYDVNAKAQIWSTCRNLCWVLLITDTDLIFGFTRPQNV